MKLRSFGIRHAVPSDGDSLIDIWRRSVSATHLFLRQGDLDTLSSEVRQLSLETLDTWVFCDGRGSALGFLVLTVSHVDALFIAPEWIRRGGGSILIRHAGSLRGPLTVDVNEQNLTALNFYRALDFVAIGRSESDDAGRPFPILHLADSQHEHVLRIREQQPSALLQCPSSHPSDLTTRVGSPHVDTTPDDPTVLSSLTLRPRIPAW